ncbi:hypothetical protein VQ02_06820 [Methylobacterium variabile]|uniref:Uncharacterized protein n=1 Tax=Methylobacterium variabile TaxID=298794 RepID=A0A0J6T5P4_9HYPH|nr:type VI secretion system tip protein TssI/VgrG [Methylobacterium variabile]KMO40883.1 hypothetical protein VQ02_06820 [Methylobacterium variabile]
MTGGLSPLLLLDTPLGGERQPFQPGTLHAVAMTARERISAPYEIDITAVSTERSIDPDRLLYKPVGLTVRRKDGTDRHFHGIVRRVDSVGLERRGRWEYRLEVVPRLWFLDQTVDCRIFQQQTAEQILGDVLSEHDVSAVDFRLFGRATVRPYTTQFDETDLQFVQRIMQESGYFYFFEHEETKHTLVIANKNQTFRPQDGALHRVIFQGDNVDIIDDWSEGQTTASGSVRIQDYDPEKPQRPVEGQQRTRLGTAGAGKRSVYRWPAMTMDKAVAEDRARFRQEAAEAAAALCRGHGFDPRMSAGRRFTLASDPVTQATNVDFVVHGVTHRASDETWLGGTAPPTYDCEFVCFQHAVAWRDDLTIPRPAMTGIFSAIVLGEAGQEIHADELARIKVQPLFDHRKDTTAAKSIFVRVLHAWSGNRWGWQHLPRVGTEVGISFMNGDPDNPVVVGCFYHQDDQPVFAIPREQTKQGFRSRSTPKGGTRDFNELSFDDAKGRELVYLHTQKNHTIEVENDQSVTVERDRTVVVKQDETVTIGRNETIESQRGDISITADLGTITLKSGLSRIEISKTGIVISGPLIKIN